MAIHILYIYNFIMLNYYNLCIKYAHLNSTHFFVPFAVETSGVLGEAAEEFVRELGRHLFKITGEPRSREYLLQRIYINRCAEGKCGSNPRHHGEATARQLGMTFACLDACM